MRRPSTPTKSTQDKVSSSLLIILDLVIDLEWYIVQQILPPISRILSPLEGIQIKRIAELLGVDSRKYEH